MNEMLEFQQIKEMLKAYAMTEKARERLEALKPIWIRQERRRLYVKPRREDEFWMLLEILLFQLNITWLYPIRTALHESALL